ncbi:MAG: sulfotransferase [Gammaproteobacteria bacterium]|nr:sulfotransferase [Gammaproteobacteria bacterium]
MKLDVNLNQPSRALDLGRDESWCFFVVGPPRAGTTMLRLMLNRHPDVCVPAETWFFPQLMERATAYGSFDSDAAIELFSRDAAKRWRFAIEDIEYGRWDPGSDRLFTLLYEDLVTNPDSCMRDVCHFLDLDFEPGMLQFHRDARMAISGLAADWHQSLSQPITPTHIGRFRKDQWGQTRLIPIGSVPRLNPGSRVEKEAARWVNQCPDQSTRLQCNDVAVAVL